MKKSRTTATALPPRLLRYHLYVSDQLLDIAKMSIVAEAASQHRADQHRGSLNEDGDNIICGGRIGPKN